MEVLELKNTITNLKSSKENFDNKPDREEQRVSKLTDKSHEISPLEKQKEWKNE